MIARSHLSTPARHDATTRRVAHARARHLPVMRENPSALTTSPPPQSSDVPKITTPTSDAQTPRRSGSAAKRPEPRSAAIAALPGVITPPNAAEGFSRVSALRSDIEGTAR